ncbi:MAG: ABC transporter permease [Planctomycetaceae bacterium]|nr:ABC transporter permease [Planctomycetaceae bacterium]
MNKKYFYALVSVLSLCGFFLIWYLVTEVLHWFPPQALPDPMHIVRSFIRKWSSRAPDGGTLPQHIWASLHLALYGFLLGAVIGIPLGIIMGWNRTIDLLVTPMFQILRPIPPIAWIPIMLIFFGIGQTAKAAVIFVSTVTNCILNSYYGIKQTRDVHLWVSRTFGASSWQMLWTIAIPSALPMIFAGLNLSLNVAWMSLVAAEMLAANKGLGYMIQYNRMMARADYVIVGMIAITLVGAILTKILSMVENAVVKGRHLGEK